EKIEADLIIAMAGRATEELFFGKNKVTTGAMSDIQQATRLARYSVTEWGLSEKMGPVAYQEAELGYGETRQRTNMSNETAREVDNEVRKMVEIAYKGAKEMVSKYKKEVSVIAKALLEFETLSGDEVKKIIAGEKLDRKPIKIKPVLKKA
ncbi:MAG: cell division protein FtsH, partial [Alphaproteobacteria bacterium]|nr:cell division protein FtsH [Alphaproteobacteria bacterium]